MPKDDVTAQIESAFANTPAPGDAFDDISATKWDEGIMDYFRGTTWRGHSVHDLHRHSAALSFFTDKAFQFWLPAFMLAEIENPQEADVISEHIAYSLTDNAGARLRPFAEVELKAIASFLELCAGKHADGIHYRDAERAVRAELQKA